MHVPRGMMRHVLTAQNPTQATDAYGQATETWLSVGSVPAHIEQMDTDETVDDGGPAVQTTYRILSAWHPSVTTRTRFLWVDRNVTRTLNVRSCTDKDQRQRTLEIVAVEVVL
jgi:SPP1 family predicted phage head-tail adaptor